ncbi:helix-turn-helix domain-containing protein [Paenibacillus soyae]|uniref:AraC family transcriptional regulator n=1 Tax=Paenibacillus soyae TaxID=2969249 RepID=A0A9X2SA94_9BACL|nr:AraC family transcriptional regulator [Paenibacillus soyae]MCR2806359.1 AraC family transcriptional regulator [Paenibacillus soyae]
MLPFRLFHHTGELDLPLSLYSCGLHPQHAIDRPIGYPTFQCMICFAGSGTFQLEGTPSIELRRGELMFVPSKLAHSYSPSETEPWILGYMGFEGSFADSFLGALRLPMMKPIAINEHEVVQLESELRQLWHMSEREGENAYREASTKIYHLLTYIAAIVCKEKPVPSNRSHAGTKEQLCISVQYMEQHYMEDLSLANIAYAVGYSKQHFQRKFKELYGMNPKPYLQRLRLLKGIQLLEEDSGLSIGEIAARVGMELNYFVRLFKWKHGTTPAKYRSSFREFSREFGERHKP